MQLNIITMKKSFLLFLLVALAFGAQAQIASSIYWIQFADKANSPYSIENPEAYLSQRALQRRANQGIAIDEYDIPVNPQYLQGVADCGAELINPSKWLNGVTVKITDPYILEAVNALDYVVAVRNCEDNPEAQLLKQRWMEKELSQMEVSGSARGYYGDAYMQSAWHARFRVRKHLGLFASATWNELLEHDGCLRPAEFRGHGSQGFVLFDSYGRHAS